MRHHDTVKKFGRVKRQREALMRGLARSLVLHERIETTEARAKALRPFVEKLVTKAGSGTLASRRLVGARLGTEDQRAAQKLMNNIAPRYKDRKGGYTRITKLPRRQGDASPMAVIEFV